MPFHVFPATEYGGGAGGGGASGGSTNLSLVMPGDVPTPPSAGGLRLIARQLGGWPLLATVLDDGRLWTMLPDLGVVPIRGALIPDGAGAASWAVHGLARLEFFGGPPAIQVPTPASPRQVLRAYGARWTFAGGAGFCTAAFDNGGASILREHDFLAVSVFGYPEHAAGKELFLGVADAVMEGPAGVPNHLGLLVRNTDGAGQCWLSRRTTGDADSTRTNLGATLNADDLYLLAIGWRGSDTSRAVVSLANLATSTWLMAEQAITDHLPSLGALMHYQAGTNNRGVGATGTLVHCGMAGFVGLPGSL